MNSHSHSFFLFFFLLLSWLHLSYSDDASTMIKLSQSFTPSPPGWSGPNPCKWTGVSCDSSRQVIFITLISKSVSGKLPPDLINSLSALQSLALSQNQISGPLPSLSNLKNLQEVLLESNLFSSVPTGFLSNLPNLQRLSLGNNPLSPWTLPGTTLSNLTSLQSLSASNASIYGQIPDVFGSLPSLQTLRLSYNNLSGPLPPSLAGSAIQNLLINDQKVGLSGQLLVLDGMSSLAQVWAHDNAFVGPVPGLSKSDQLFDLQLRGNQLSGIVPSSLSSLPKLVNISLQKNMLQGPVPVFGKGVLASVLPNSFCNPSPGPCDPQVSVLLVIAGALGYPTSLAESWKGNDACKDWSHVTCDSAGKAVTGLNLAKQGLVGTISPAFANLTSLDTLVLSDNHLYGRIPNTLTSLHNLRRLDVSKNNLTGEVPEVSKSVVVNVDGNPFIGTNVDTTPQTPGSSPSRGKGKSKSSSSLSPGVIVAIVIVIVVVLAFLVWLICFRKGKLKVIVREWLRKVKGRQRHGTINYSISPTRGTIHPYDGSNARYSIEVLKKATNNFSDDNICGKGGFGIVYKGVLVDGTEIAVKRMESNSLGKGSSEFKAEIAVLSKVRHRHLVALLGYCSHGNERLVVYEYMPKGTLGQHLLGWKASGLAPLTWRQRLVIALDVARGVEYLHSLAQQSFIHRDLKPTNILLGNDMRAKVSDFGLVKDAPDGKGSVETRLAGTFGYLAPEYASTGRVTTKVDVFAFGVVLMEIIAGRKALDEALPEESVQLVNWFRRVLIDKDRLRKSIDPTLDPDEEMYGSICKAAELAGHCTAREPSQRPEMGHAVNVLSPLVEQWQPTKSNSDEDSFAIDISLPQAMSKWQAGESSVISDYNNSNVASTAPTTPGFGNTFRDDVESR